jgi:hypothetical protein
MFPKSTLWLASAVFASLIVIVLSIAAQTSSDKSDGGLLPSASQGSNLTDIKTMIHASDEEWKVIGPKLRRVMAAYAAVETRVNESNTVGSGLMSMGPGGFDGFGGGPPGGGGFGNDSFSGPGDSGSFGRGGPGFGGPGRGNPPGSGGFGRGGMGEMTDFTGGAPGFGGRGRGGPPGSGGSGNNAVMQKLTELQKTLTDSKATPEQFKEKIAAVRNERKKAKAELEAAQKDLRQLLTQDQEAILIGFGCLD